MSTLFERCCLEAAKIYIKHGLPKNWETYSDEALWEYIQNNKYPPFNPFTPERIISSIQKTGGIIHKFVKSEQKSKPQILH